MFYFIAGDVRTKKGHIIITSAGKLSPALHYTLSQSIGRGRISHVGSLVVFRIGIVVRESRDCGVIKFPQKDPTILAWFFLKNAVCIISRKIAVLAAEAPTFVCVWGGRY